MSKPYLTLDTNVCGKLQQTYKTDLPEIVRRMNSEFRIVVSPQTAIELVSGLVTSDEEYFEEDKEKLRIMLGTKSPRFLPFSATFAIEKALGLKAKVSPLNPAEFRNQIRLILSANSLKALFEDGVRLRIDPKRKVWTFDRELHKKQHQLGVDEHNKVMAWVRTATIAFPAADVWATKIAKQLDYQLSPEQADVLGRALDASYHHFKDLCHEVSSGNYKYERREGDWIDGMQLFYLSDPNLYILTDDGGILRRCRRSSQKDRLLLLRDFLQKRGFRVRH